MDLFSRFFRENQEKFLAFAYSYIRNWAEAEDILMESMISLWECRDRWEEDKGLHALLLTIIKNKALNYLEHEQTRLRIEEDLYAGRMIFPSFVSSSILCALQPAIRATANIGV